MLERIDEAGTVTKLDYDPAGRIESRSILVNDENGETHETDKENYAYDPSGRLAGTQNAHSRHQYFYDKLGNLIREYRHDSLDGTARSHVWHHRYDALGNRTETIRPDGQRIGYLHYGSGHLHGITLNRNEIAAFERDKLHRETERTFGKHIRQETQYDPMGRILQQIHNRSRREYSYDAAGQLTHIQSKGGQIQYRYDPIGRLIAAVTPDFSETFAFDPAGNRLDLSGNKQDHTGQTNSQEKPSLNKVWGNLLKEYAGVHYDYDQRGNLIRKTRNGETTDYHWNGYNQLIKIENRNGSTEYRYDPLGRRTAKIRNGETTVYHWQEDTLAIESENGQNIHYLFEPGTFEPLAQFQTASPIGIEREDKPAEPYSYDPETDPLLKIPPEPQEQSETQPELVYYQLDHLGTPIAAHNAKGEAVWTVEYEAWGRIRNETVLDGLKANIPFRFQGQYYDEESGLHYNRFRYYDPEIGRFVSQDPIGLRGGMNLFEYAPNPVGWTDPFGLLVTPHYTKGLNGRVERVQATITKDDLGKGTATNPSSRLEAQAMANCKKVHAGHFLAKNLGGSGGVGHVFPQTPGINTGLYRAFEMRIAKKIRDHGSGKVDILFKYPNANSKMPNAIFYTYEIGGERFTQQFVNPNPCNKT